MKRQAFQPGEIRDEQDNIIRPGAYGKNTALATSDNMGILDYIINNFQALFDMISGACVYVDELSTSGDTDKLYVVKSTGKTYRWDGKQFILVSEAVDGLSAYEIAKQNGFTGTEEEWLESIRGEKGDSITGATVDSDGYLILTLSTGTTIKTALKPLVDAKQYADNAAKSAESAEDSYNKTASIQTDFQVVLDTAKASETSASASASTATAQANTATTQANNAKTSATNSAASASASAKSASNAKTSETNAGSSATTAKNWAVSETSPDGATDTDSGTGKTQSSRTWALESKASAESASSSASIATTQASSASTSAANASKSATAASGSATNAKAAMNTANTAASSASTSATNASTSASNAAKAEVAAKTAQAEAEKARNDANSAVTKLTGVMKYAGQVDNYSDLADVTKNKGDVWNIVNADPAHGIKAGDNVAWNGAGWDNLSGTVDLSIYAEKADYQKTITSATANGATITFNHKDGTTSTATINNVASATAATNDAKGQKIDATYEKIVDASNVHTSLQNSINGLSTGKQDKLTFDKAPTANSSNPVTSGGIKTALDTKPDKTGEGASGTWGINITGNAKTATKATQDASGNVIADTYAKKTEVTVKGVKVDGSTSPLVPDSSGVVTIPSADLSDYATKNYVQQLINTLSTVSVTQDSLTKALSIK